MDLKKEIMDDIEKAQLSAEEILRKYDKESDKRELTGVWNTIINAICIIFCIFQVYTAAFGILDAQLQRAVHLAFGFALVFLLCILPRFGIACWHEQRNGLHYSAYWHAAGN